MDEKVVEQSMEIITYSGNGRAQVINALRQLFKDGDIAKAREEIAAGGKEIGEAHQMQTDLISAECDGQEVEKSVLLIHAQDHTLVNLLVEAGDLTEEEAKYHPKKNVLMKALGASEKCELDIFDVVDVKLLKQKGYVRYNPVTFKEDYGIDPIRIIDLKALSGDASDNVPGVKGIGEKTALKLLKEYGSLENIYANIDMIKGSVHDKLVNDRDSAFFSKDICTIYKEVPLKDELKDMVYTGSTPMLDELFAELEFYSLLKKIPQKEKNYQKEYKILKDVNEIKKDKIISYYIECDKENYHLANILGAGVYDGENLFYVEKEKVKEVIDYIKGSIKYTYDLKKNMILLKDFNLNTIFDNMIATYLLNYQIKEDLAYLMNNEGIDVPFYSDALKNEEDLKIAVTLKANKNWVAMRLES